MLFTIPIYVEVIKGTSRGQEFAVRPLFFPYPRRQHEKLERALQRLGDDLREHLVELGKSYRHEELARWSFSPELDASRLDVELHLRRRTCRMRLLFVSFEALGRRLAFSPGVPDAWFELARGEALHERAVEALAAHFKRLEKEQAHDFEDPEKCGLDGTAWITPLEVRVAPAQHIAPPVTFAALGAEGEMDGDRELRRVGRCLDHLYPDDLDRVVLRDAEVAEFTRLLKAADRRPVLLLGPAQVGKTAILHEYVFHLVADRRERRADPWEKNVWHLSPQRLISGMSSVGQWENRLLAILKEAQKRDHVLYFDDLLGLYFAGQSSQSSLSVAHVLKPYIERREVRLVGEMTPDSFRVLRERDRGFADLFHLVPVAEPSETDNLRVLIQVVRQLESQHRVRFKLDVLPSVLDLTRRYSRHLAFPGKAALFLRRLAVKYRNGEVTRHEALAEFHEQSGLSMTFLDAEQKLSRADVLKALSADTIGQPRALEVASDVIGIAKARLNDPDRPLASFLFLGPTGVGKTQCAKGIAKYLFGNAERLLRFDMNEFLAAGSAARLAGTFDQPEGLLTAAVRRRPFAVVLFDEIEKAHPEVFDLLLQVLGEGRLSDAMGRTVDFTNTLIFLTSNLGVREASASLGFTSGDGHREDTYTQAAQRFFRPEFFNRLDRIVPFGRLARSDISRIADLLIRDVLLREGLVRRKCVLRVEPAALERIIDEGFDPVLGARALKRAIEQQLAQPVAERLAQGLPETITLIDIYPVPGSIRVAVQGLTEVERLPEDHRKLGQPEDVLRGVSAALRRIEDRFAHLRPVGALDARSLEEENAFYFLIQDRVRSLRQQARELGEVLEEARRPSQGVPSLPIRQRWGPVKETWIQFGPRYSNVLHEMSACQDLRLYLDEMASRARSFGTPQERGLLELVEELAVLDAMADGVARGEERVLVYVWTPSAGGCERVDRLYENYLEGGVPEATGVVRVALDGEQRRSERAMVLTGLAAELLTAGESGTHLFVPEHTGIVPVQVHDWRIGEKDDPLQVIHGWHEARRAWMARLATGESGPEDDPLRPGPVVRIYNEGKGWIDLRTGLVGQHLPLVPALARGRLKLPAEVRVGG